MVEHKILLVDDDRDLLEMLCSIFRRAGYTDLVTASSGQEALQVWREQQPALIVLDVMMPGMDGFEVLREIRRTSRVPVLMLTARGEAEDRIEGLEIGADDYLPKPFLPRELLLRVGAILHRTYPEPNRKVELAASTVDLEKAEVWKDGERTPLTAKELQPRICQIFSTVFTERMLQEILPKAEAVSGFLLLRRLWKSMVVRFGQPAEKTQEQRCILF